MKPASTLLALLFAAAGMAAGTRTEIRTPVELASPLGGAVALEVRIPDATLEVTGGGGSAVTVAGTMETLHRDPQRARDLAEGCGLALRREGATLVLEPRYPSGALGREARKGRVRFHLTIALPSSLPLGIHAGAGDITLKGEFRASLVVETRRGDIRLDFTPAFREVDARTLAGRVRGFPETALRRFYFSPVGQRRLWLDPSGGNTAFIKTLRGDIILSRKGKP